MGSRYRIAWILFAALTAFNSTQATAQKKNPPNFGHVHALTMDSSGQTVFLGAHTGLFRSSDDGRSWSKVPVSNKHAHIDVMDIAPDPREPTTIYVATHEVGVLKSIDGGKTWREVNSGLKGLDVHGLAIDPKAPATLHAAVRGENVDGFYRTTDGGSKWTRVDDGPEGEIKVLKSVDLPSGMGGIFLYAGTSTGLRRSPDCF